MNAMNQIIVSSQAFSGVLLTSALFKELQHAQCYRNKVSRIKYNYNKMSPCTWTGYADEVDNLCSKYQLLTMEILLLLNEILIVFGQSYQLVLLKLPNHTD